MTNSITMKKEELLITASQAQLALPKQEEERLSVAVTEMLNYFEKMNEVDVENLAPTTHALVRENALRLDVSNVENTFNNSQEALINRAPEKNNNFIVIPNVL